MTDVCVCFNPIRTEHIANGERTHLVFEQAITKYLPESFEQKSV